MSNPADAKLRAHNEALQHTAIVRGERLVKHVDRTIRAAWQEVLGMMANRTTDPFKVRQALLTVMGSLIFEMRQKLAVIGQDAFDAAVYGWARSVPRSQWRATLLLPIPLQEKTGDAFDYLAGPLQFEPEYEPVIGKLSDAELEELLKKVLFEPPSEADLAIVVNTSQAGRSAWPEKLAREGLSFDQISHTITSRLASGGNVQDVAREVLPLVNGVKSRAERIARTESLRVANTMQRRISLQADDLIAGYQRIATIDQYTEPSHAAKNGMIFYKPEHASAGALTTESPEYVELPERPNCRCYYSPVLIEPQEFKDSPEFADEFENIGGQTIPDPAAYDDWFRRQDVETQRQAVGKARFAELKKRLKELGENRKPDWLDFIDEGGELLSREKLKGESVESRAARRAKVDAVLRKREAMFRQVSAMGFVRRG